MWEPRIEFLVVNTTASNEELKREFKHYLDDLENRIALPGGKQTRSPRVAVPIDSFSRKRRKSIVAALKTSRSGRSSKSDDKSKDAFSIWQRARVLPYMDLKLSAAFALDFEMTDDLMAACLSEMFPASGTAENQSRYAETETTAGDRIKTTQKHILMLSHRSSRIFGELRRVAMGQLAQKLQSPDFEVTAKLIEDQARNHLARLVPDNLFDEVADEDELWIPE